MAEGYTEDLWYQRRADVRILAAQDKVIKGTHADSPDKHEPGHLQLSPSCSNTNIETANHEKDEGFSLPSPQNEGKRCVGRYKLLSSTFSGESKARLKEAFTKGKDYLKMKVQGYHKKILSNMSGKHKAEIEKNDYQSDEENTPNRDTIKFETFQEIRNISTGLEVASECKEKLEHEPFELLEAKSESDTTIQPVMTSGVQNGEGEDDLPLGSDAKSLNGIPSTDAETQPSCLLAEKTSTFTITKQSSTLLEFLDRQPSCGSDQSGQTTSSLNSIEMLLQGRETDPEEILMNLGFGDNMENENVTSRVPERFLVNKSDAHGVNIEELLAQRNELNQLVETWKHQRNSTGSFGLTPYLHGMRFVASLCNSSRRKSLSRDKHLQFSDSLSILHPENQKALAEQGFYELYREPKQYAAGSVDKQPNTWIKTGKAVMDAAERRMKFKTSRESHPWSLIEPDSGVEESQSNSKGSSNFHAQSMSIDSVDSIDSVSSPVGKFKRSLCDIRRSHIANNLKYQEYSFNNGLHGISKLREQQATKMTFEDDDGNYFVTPPLSKQTTLNEMCFLKSCMFDLNKREKSGISELKEATAEKIDMEKQTSLEDDVFNREDSDVLKEELNDLIVDYRKFKTDQCSDAESSSDQTLVDQLLDVSKIMNVTNSEVVKSDYQLPEKDNLNANNFQYGIQSEMSTAATRRNEEKDVLKFSTDDTFTPNIVLETVCKPQMPSAIGGFCCTESAQSGSSGFADGDNATESAHMDLLTVNKMGNSEDSDATISSFTTMHCSSIASNSTIVANGSYENSDQSISTDTSVDYVMESENSFSLKPVMCHVGVDTGMNVSDLKDLTFGCVQTAQKSSQTDALCMKYQTSQHKLENLSETSQVVLDVEFSNDWQQVLDSQKKLTADAQFLPHGKRHVSVLNLYVNNGQIWFCENEKVVESNSADFSQLAKYNFHDQRNFQNARHFDIESDQDTMNTDKDSVDFEEGRSISACIFCSSAMAHSRCYLHNNILVGSENNHALGNFEENLSKQVNQNYASPQEKTIEYKKLLKLINQKNSKKGVFQHVSPAYIPGVEIIDWCNCHINQQLCEETRLMQYALQKYKADLQALEGSFVMQFYCSEKFLSIDDQMEIEEMYIIWTDISLEVVEMERHLSDRWRRIRNGDSELTPLIDLHVIQQIIEIMKEQLYLQHISQDDGTDYPTDSILSNYHHHPGWKEISQEIQDLKHQIKGQDSLHNIYMKKAMDELKQSLLTEVHETMMRNLAKVKNAF